MFNEPQQKQMRQALFAFIDADRWLKSKEIMQQAQALLLTNEAELALLALMAQYIDNRETSETLMIYSILLRRCRQQGIEAAFAETLRTTPAAQETFESVHVMDELPDETLRQAMLIKPLRAFVISSSDWFDARQIVEENPNLLSAEADAMLAQLIKEAQAQEYDDAVPHFQIHRERLARARKEGLDAIAPAMSAEQRSILEYLKSLPEELGDIFLEPIRDAFSPEELEAALQQLPASVAHPHRPFEGRFFAE